jgi:hypothetical protein
LWVKKYLYKKKLIGGGGRNFKMLQNNSLDNVTFSAEIYKCEFCTLFERQILRKIFGPVNIDNTCRIRNNMEIDKLIEGADTVRFIKAQRIKCLGHIQRMDRTRPARRLLDWKRM